MEGEWLEVVESARRKNRIWIWFLPTSMTGSIRMCLMPSEPMPAASSPRPKNTTAFLIEDAATVWHLGWQRYKAIAESYQALLRDREKRAIDRNIIDRYQNVYPTERSRQGRNFINSLIRGRRICGRSHDSSRIRCWRPIGRCSQALGQR
jgi:hypothetical protein